jgi:hypothetical protein
MSPAWSDEKSTVITLRGGQKGGPTRSREARDQDPITLRTEQATAFTRHIRAGTSYIEDGSGIAAGRETRAPVAVTARR